MASSQWRIWLPDVEFDSKALMRATCICAAWCKWKLFDRLCDILQDMAYVLATGYVASSILLSGFYLRIKDIKIGFIRALSWLSYTKYAMQGVGRVELAGRTWDPSTCQQTSTGQCFPTLILCLWIGL